MILHKIAERIDSIQLPAGYTASGILVTTPMWVQSLTEWSGLGAAVLGVGVGITTIWLNIVKIRKAGGK